jgi:hypothetical protein
MELEDKLTERPVLPTELATLCSTLSSEELSGTTVFSSWNISFWT